MEAGEFKKETENETHTTKTIAFVHHKGGTGKTTSCLNVAGWLAKMGKQVLVVDLDPQGNATAGLGIDRKSLDGSIYDVFFGTRSMEEIILETGSNVYLAPSSLDLLAAETHMAGQIGNAGILKTNLDNIKETFDHILIDVPPASTLLMINGIVASENIIIPLDSGVFAYETLETLKTLVIDLSKEMGVATNIMMVLLKGYSASIFDKGPTRNIKKLVKGFLSKNVTMAIKVRVIPFSRKIYEAQMRGEPISRYAPHSHVGRIYRKIAEEIVGS
ncbi:MAG: AAA family ATPase [Candidatus Omnitrophica bacterium]|nr:AAA family ATPase [Candidatus Omnitrophota bacterium]MBU1785179.1 AAA family ATPase [Candidatus Omnitrophota bacterium]MBU1851157.1 AAA family ATPase [Candidatus Omnitrophota bacterium]